MILPCGHQCQNRCGEKCNTDRCQKKIEKLLLCGHLATVPCCEPFNKIKCEVKCRDILPCGHECRGTCFDCFRGTLHKACQDKCKKTYICGHSCKKKCNEPCGICPMKCEYKCCEAKCDKKCGKYVLSVRINANWDASIANAQEYVQITAIENLAIYLVKKS